MGYSYTCNNLSVIKWPRDNFSWINRYSYDRECPSTDCMEINADSRTANIMQDHIIDVNENHYLYLLWAMAYWISCRCFWALLVNTIISGYFDHVSTYPEKTKRWMKWKKFWLGLAEFEWVEQMRTLGLFKNRTLKWTEFNFGERCPC